MKKSIGICLLGWERRACLGGSRTEDLSRWVERESLGGRI